VALVIDPLSPTWQAVSQVLKDQIEASRLRLEQHGTSDAITEFHRGRIAMAKFVLEMRTPKDATVKEPSLKPPLYGGY
jgi:hypothetical protein